MSTYAWFVLWVVGSILCRGMHGDNRGITTASVGDETTNQEEQNGNYPKRHTTLT